MRDDDLDKREHFRRSMPSYGPDWDAAIEFGIDMELLEANLALTPEQRLQELMNLIRLAEELDRVREGLHGAAK